MNRKASFAALLAVIGLSIVFGMVLGGRLNAPPGAFAAKPGTLVAFPQADGSVASPGLDFSAIAEQAIPAVVSVTNTSVHKATAADYPFHTWLFGPQEGSPEGRRRSASPDERRVSSGSGFIVSKDGYIFTNNHVVDGATKIEVALDGGERYTAELVGSDPTIDLALIKIDPNGTDLPTLPLGDSDKLRAGEWLIAIGNPLELEHTVTVGVVSAKKRDLPIGDTIPGIASFIQTDAAINFGNSGGPLLNSRGQVVGINTAIVRGDFLNRPGVEGIGFALAINEARKAAEQLRESGSVKRGYLGIDMNPAGIDQKAREYYGLPDGSGVIIRDVVPNGPASKAGIEAGDIIRKIDGESVRNNVDLLSKVASRRPGERVKLEVFRNGKRREVEVVLAERNLEQAESRSAPDAGTESESGDEVLGIKVAGIGARERDRLQLQDSARGVVIVSVDGSSDAAEEGIQPGLVINAINDHNVTSVADWNRVIKGIRAGSSVKLDIVAPDRSFVVFVRASGGSH